MADGVAEKSLQLPWRRLDGKVVMVTGASSGIGRDICLVLARAGCNIVAAARRIDRLESLCEEINRMGSSSDPQLSTVRSVAVELDVSAQGSLIQASVQKAWDAFGRIDALVNSAGIRGLLYGTRACCGSGGGVYNFNPKVFSGISKIINGRKVTTTACSDPHNYVSWDGIHATEAADKLITLAILNGSYFDPAFPISGLCDLHPLV